MFTLRNYFDQDFKDGSVQRELHLNTSAGEVVVLIRVYHDFQAHVKFYTMYIPATPAAGHIAMHILRNEISQFEDLDTSVGVGSKLPGDALTESAELKFSGKVFVYSESDLQEGAASDIQSWAKGSGIVVQVRSEHYLSERNRHESPRGFISHDSRDKELIARPLAKALWGLSCPVWYDEYSLKLGDNLRENIEKGIRESQKCIIILSKNFLENQGWAKMEYESIFAKQIIEKRGVVIPVWCDVKPDDVYRYSPSLSGVLGAQIDDGIDVIARKIAQVLNG